MAEVPAISRHKLSLAFVNGIGPWDGVSREFKQRLDFYVTARSNKRGNAMELAPLLQEYGVMVTLVVFFVWQSWKREQRLSNRIDTIEGEYTQTLRDLVKRSSDVIAANTEIMEHLKKHLARREPELD